jgi:hypothetical protein
LLQHPQEQLEAATRNPAQVECAVAPDLFFTAIAKDDMDLLGRATEGLRGCEIDTPKNRRKEETCLRLAVAKGNVEAVRVLVESRMFQYEPRDVMEALGDKPEFMAVLHESGWMVARGVYDGRTDIVRDSVESHRGSLEYRLPGEVPPLFVAIRNRNLDLVRFLVEHGAALSYEDGLCRVTALQAAVTNYVQQSKKAFMESKSINIAEQAGNNQGDLSRVLSLGKQGMLLGGRSNNRNLEMIKYLTEPAVLAKTRASEQFACFYSPELDAFFSPLAIALYSGDWKLTELFMNSGAAFLVEEHCILANPRLAIPLSRIAQDTNTDKSLLSPAVFRGELMASLNALVQGMAKQMACSGGRVGQLYDITLDVILPMVMANFPYAFPAEMREEFEKRVAYLIAKYELKYASPAAVMIEELDGKAEKMEESIDVVD